MAATTTISGGAYIAASALAALIGGGSAYASGKMSNAASAKAAKDSFLYSVALQNLQNSWSERMANTAHQREVNDLRAAGLNPVLSATGGNGAPTPAPGSSTISEGSSAYDINLLDGIQRAVDMKNQIRSTNSQIKLNDSQVEVNDEQKNNLTALTDKYYNDIVRENSLAENTITNNTAKTLAEIDYIKEQTRLLGYNAETNRIGANASMGMTQYYKARMPFQNTYDRFTGEKNYWSAKELSRIYNITGGDNPSIPSKWLQQVKYYNPIHFGAIGSY